MIRAGWCGLFGERAACVCVWTALLYISKNILLSAPHKHNTSTQPKNMAHEVGPICEERGNKISDLFEESRARACFHKQAINSLVNCVLVQTHASYTGGHIAMIVYKYDALKPSVLFLFVAPLFTSRYRKQKLRFVYASTLEGDHIINISTLCYHKCKRKNVRIRDLGWWVFCVFREERLIPHWGTQHDTRGARHKHSYCQQHMCAEY